MGPVRAASGFIQGTLIQAQGFLIRILHYWGLGTEFSGFGSPVSDFGSGLLAKAFGQGNARPTTSQFRAERSLSMRPPLRLRRTGLQGFNIGGRLITLSGLLGREEKNQQGPVAKTIP